MNTLLLLGVCLIITINDCVSGDDTEQKWKSFKETYKKRYDNREIEETRKQIFKDNMLMIDEHNKKTKTGEATFKMRMNQFGDLTHAEFLKRFSYREKSNNGYDSDAVNEVYYDDYDNEGYSYSPPKSHEWKQPEEVISVREQGVGKRGWAYSVADAIAGRCFVSKNCEQDIPFLSVKYLIDCSKNIADSHSRSSKACNLVKLNKKMPDEKSYKKLFQHKCNVDKYKNAVELPIKSCPERTVKNSNKSDKLRTAIFKHGPVSGAVSVEQPSFQFAHEGIYYEENCEEVPNHDVLVVGHGTENGHDYWIVKNSFGTSWGNNGFLNISAKQTANGCTVLREYLFPIFKRNKQN